MKFGWTRALAWSVIAATACRAAHAATVWSGGGADVTFTKLSGADPALPGNQDVITNLIAITRGGFQGIYNAVTESGYTHNFSPADTAWAFSGLAGNPGFSYGSGAAVYPTLIFNPWETALGGSIGLQTNITANAGVVHLLTDDIYIDIQFTAWGSGRFGDSSFTYTRAANPVGGGLVNLVWGGASDNWSNGAAWVGGPPYPNNGSPPGSIYNVTISGGAVNLDVNATIHVLTLTGGTLIGAGNITLVGGNISGAYNLTGNTNILEGTLLFASGTQSAGPISGAGNLSVAPGASLTSGAVNVNSWTLGGAAAIRQGSTLSRLPMLNLAGIPGAWTGILDLTNNALIVGSATNTTTFADVQSQIIQAAGTPAPANPWNGAGGITSSTAAAASTTATKTALGYASGAEFTALTGFTLFGGMPFNPTDTLVKYTLVGDANLDGTVNINDFFALSGHINLAGDWSQGNFNYAGNITIDDFFAMTGNFGKTLGAASLLPAASSPAPEPASFAMLLTGAAFLPRRWRTRPSWRQFRSSRAR